MIVEYLRRKVYLISKTRVSKCFLKINNMIRTEKYTFINRIKKIYNARKVKLLEAKRINYTCMSKKRS